MADIDSHFAGVAYPGSLSLNKWTKATCNHGQDGPLVLSWLNSMPETVRARVPPTLRISNDIDS